MAAFVKQALDYLLARSQTQLHIIADSQAALPTMFYCAQPKHLSRLSQLTLIQPLGGAY